MGLLKAGGLFKSGGRPGSRNGGKLVAVSHVRHFALHLVPANVLAQQIHGQYNNNMKRTVQRFLADLSVPQELRAVLSGFEESGFGREF
jgi:hypothetical protein